MRFNPWRQLFTTHCVWYEFNIFLTSDYQKKWSDLYITPSRVLNTELNCKVVGFWFLELNVGCSQLTCMRVHNRGSQIPLYRRFFFSISLSRPILRPNPDPVPFFLRDFFLDYWNRRYIRLTFQQVSALMVKVLYITISDRHYIFCFAYFFVRASVHVSFDFYF